MKSTLVKHCVLDYVPLESTVVKLGKSPKALRAMYALTIKSKNRAEEMFALIAMWESTRLSETLCLRVTMTTNLPTAIYPRTCIPYRRKEFLRMGT